MTFLKQVSNTLFGQHYPLRLILRRMQHEWRLLGLLLFAVCLITGFFSLGPLYLRTVTEVDLRTALEDADPDDLLIEVNSSAPLTAEDQDLIEQDVGGLVTNTERYIRAEYTEPDVGSGGAGDPGSAGNAVCGFNFTIGQDPLLFPPGFNGVCYQPHAYYDLGGKVDVVEGRLPQRGPTPEQVAAREVGLSDEELQELRLGVYRRGDVEAVVTQEIAERGALQVGARFYIGNFSTGSAGLSRVVIVGIVEPRNPEAPYWSGMALRGVDAVINNLGQTRYEYGLLFQPDAYEDWVAPVLPPGVDTNYFWTMQTDPDAITSDNAVDIRENIDGLAAKLTTSDRNVLVNSGLVPLLGRFDNRIGDATGPIVLLSGAVLVLMLYHLVTTVSLVLQEQGREWSSITSRGGSTLQLFELQAVTVLVLAVIAGLVGPLISRAFMIFLGYVGPLSNAVDVDAVRAVTVPQLSFILSAAAALAALIVLTLPSIPAAQQSLLRLKQATSRPPTMPIWSKYLLDFILIIIGIALLFRLYWTVSDEGTSFSTLLNNLVEEPNEVVKFVADNAAAQGGLSDPFNLIAPALVLTGFALLWLRIFPLTVRLVSRLTERNNHLATPMAIWNVERNPGHYAQLVLLLIGTLALGTASLGLQQTRDVGGWNAAQIETGGMANVELNLLEQRYENVNWSGLDNVESAVPILRESGRPANTTSRTDMTLIGINPDEFADTFPNFADDVDALNAMGVTRSGIELPRDAERLQVQVWSSANTEILTQNVEVQQDVPTLVINAYVQDANGVPYRVQLTQQGVTASAQGQGPQTLPPTPTEQWLTFSGDMPASGIEPFRLWRVGVAPRLGDVNFAHTLLLDYWQTVDVNGTTAVVEAQETNDLWQLSTSELPYPLQISETGDFGSDTFALVDNTPSGAPIFDGQNAVQIDYTSFFIRGNEPGVSINVQALPTIPAVVSEAFLRTFRVANRPDAPNLEIGDTRTITASFDTGNVLMNIEIVDIIDEFMTLQDEDNSNLLFMVVPLEEAKFALNQALITQSSRVNIADANQVWLSLNNREPTEALENELASINGVRSTTFAWDRFSEILREPLPSGIAGMLFAGFWISFILSLLDFAFYIAVTAKQRSFTFGVLRSLGWNANNIWRMLLVEQVTLVLPALLVGSVLGAALAYLLLPFLSLVGGATLQVPLFDLLLLILTLVAGFVVLLVFTALWLRQMSVNQVLRLGEE
jgi:hypothetical protein